MYRGRFHLKAAFWQCIGRPGPRIKGRGPKSFLKSPPYAKAKNVDLESCRFTATVNPRGPRFSSGLITSIKILHSNNFEFFHSWACHLADIWRAGEMIRKFLAFIGLKRVMVTFISPRIPRHFTPVVFSGCCPFGNFCEKLVLEETTFTSILGLLRFSLRLSKS